MRTINDVRNELELWSDFWIRRVKGQGYASKSNVQKLKEVCETGCAIQGTSHFINNRSESILVPVHIQEIGYKIDRLEVGHKQAIRQRYISPRVFLFSEKNIFLKLLGQAEREML